MRLMKEYKLTPEAVSSTLSVGSIMSESTEQPKKEPKQPQRNSHPHEQDLASVLRGRIRDSRSQEEAEIRRILEQMGIHEHPEDAKKRKETFNTRYAQRLTPEFDVLNQLDPESNDPEADTEQPVNGSGNEFWSTRRREQFARRYAGSPFAHEAQEFVNLMRNPMENLNRLRDLQQGFARRMEEGQRNQGGEFDPDGFGTDLRLNMLDTLSNIADELGETDARGDKYFDRQESMLIADSGEAGKRYREKRFNKLFESANANPSQPFGESFDVFTDKPYYRRFIEIMNASYESLKSAGNFEAADELNREKRKYTEEFSVRSTLHDANYILTTNVGPDKISEFASRLTSGQVDLAFRKKGASTAMHFYEQALIKVREENFGYLPYSEVVGDTRNGKIGRVEELARQYMRDAISAGAVHEVVGVDENTGLERKRKVEPGSMEDWEIDRAFAIARGLGVMTGRFVEIALTNKLPRGRYTSLWAHGFLGGLSPFRHSIGKFDIEEARNRFLMYRLNNKDKKWNKNELQDVTGEFIYQVVNGLVDDDDQRLMGKVNPLQTGGIVSKTGWRVAGKPGELNPNDKTFDKIKYKDEIITENPIYNETSNSAIGAMVAESNRLRAQFGSDLRPQDDPFNWVGTGILIDKAIGGGLSKPENRAELQRQLERTAKYLPTRLIFNFKEAQRYALEEFKLQTGDSVDVPHMMQKQDSRFNKALDVLIVAQERAVNEHSEQLRFDGLQGDAQVIEDAQRISEIIKTGYVSSSGSQTRLMKQLMEDYTERDYKIPFISGSEDIPWDEYRFENVGGNIVMRRWNDIAAAAAAGKGIHELNAKLLGAKNIDQVIELLHPIHSAIANYDSHKADQFILELAIGIDRFFAKDAMAELPVVGGMYALFTGKASYAQVAAGGRDGMAWDARSHFDFAKKLRSHRMINDDQERELQEITGGTPKDLAKRYSAFILQALLLAMLLKVMSGAKDAV